MLRLYSTLHRAVVPFETRDEGKVAIYLCGPTVQSEPHVGHGRSAVAFDVIRRYLIWSGLEVTYVRNVTDIEDKIIAAAAEIGESVEVLAERMAARFAAGYQALGVLTPDLEPKATEHIPEIIDLIRVLIDRGLAYASEGDVYFSVRADESYGKLSGRNPDELRSGVRIEVGEAKHDPLDFALWKAAKPGEPWWDSPWGPGRPGWHIECSAMATKYLGQDFDIHGGGTDLIFPHHENEIAQSRRGLRLGPSPGTGCTTAWSISAVRRWRSRPGSWSTWRPSPRNMVAVPCGFSSCGPTIGLRSNTPTSSSRSRRTLSIDCNAFAIGPRLASRTPWPSPASGR